MSISPNQESPTRAAPQGSPPHEDQNAPSGSKRKRVSLACNACRLRKSKCDGLRPKCGNCRDLDFHCVYQQSASSANTIVGKDYIGQLENRLLAVEKLLAAQVAMNQGRRLEDDDVISGMDHQNGDDRPLKRHRSSSHSPSEEPGPEIAKGETLINVKNGHLEDDMAPGDTVLDGMGALALGDEEDYGYFGPSSNIAFIGHVTRALATSASVTGAFPKDLKGNTEAQLENTSHPSPLSASGPSDEFEVFRSERINMYVLPSESRCRHFISLYFQNTNILFPYLHQPTFMETYETALKTGFHKVRRTWLALLNLVMAMGSRTNTERNVPAEEKYKTAEIFYQRGTALCNEHLLRLASLDSVHLLLLMSHYLQSTRKPVQCWTTHGLAIRVAIQMGLHSNQALQRFPPLERELRKRAWYGCVLLDRTLCMTFGRPSAITAYADNLDLPLDLEDSDLSNSRDPLPASTSSRAVCTSTTFYIVSIKLYTLIGRIIDDLYGGNLGGTTYDPDSPIPTFTDIARVAEIEAKLSQWRASLPQALSIISASDIPDGGGPISQFWRQSIILSLRYYNTRALLHRQFAVKGLAEIWGAGPSKDKFEGDFFWNFGWASIKACADSAIQTIEIIHKVKHRSDLLGFWWFTVFFVFNASLVLVSKILILIQVRQLQLTLQSSSPTSELSTLLAHLHKANQCLDVLATNNRIANRSRLFLKNLMRYVAPLAAASSPISVTSSHPGTPYVDMQHQQQINGMQNIMGIAAQSGMGHVGEGEFILESDLGFLSSMLPPMSAAHETASTDGWGDGGWGAVGGFGG